MPDPKLPIVPGHEIVGRIDAVGVGRRRDLDVGDAGRHPLARPDLRPLRYCRSGRENLCDHPLFTGYTRDGGYATHVVADASYVVPASRHRRRRGDRAVAVRRADRLALAAVAGDGTKIGLYGFGAAAHIIAQVARWQGRECSRSPRPGDAAAQDFARKLGASWAGSSEELPPR